MSKEEESYAPSEYEMLALISIKKHFLFYLCGKKLSVRTDHAALSNIRKFADRISRWMRLSISLSEFDIFI